jgi:hypothetical protein
MGEVGMRGLPRRIGKLGSMGVAVLAAAGTAFWVADFGGSSVAPSKSSPIDPFVDRFRTTLHGDAPAEPPPAWLTAASRTEQLSLFSPLPTYPATAPSFAPDNALTTAEPTSTGATSAAAAAPKANRKPMVFNDAQIASIKRRLNLTKDQEQYWPAVEAMLRRLAWKKPPESMHGKDVPIAERHLAALDVSSADLAQLQSTTGPLLMSFNEDQKRELRTLAHLIGLQDVLSKL